MKKTMLALSGMFAALSLFGVPTVHGYVPSSFKEKPRRGSWDAWTNQQLKKTERPCVTWKKLNSADPGLTCIGRYAARSAKDIPSSKWSIGCETLDRDYADWNVFKEFVGEIGAKRGRLFSGWAKTEQKKGVYDFKWLDPQVREMAAMGVRPWICLSYGNPVWGSDFRLGMKVKQVTENPEAFAAWLRYCTACVTRYKDVVTEWEIWNEPFRQGPEYAELVLRTARAVRAVQPEAKILVTAITMGNAAKGTCDYVTVMERLKAENALDLVDRFIYHPYESNPDASYKTLAEPLRKLVKSYSPKYDIIQGEVGCPAQLEFAHALAGVEWTEYSQAKWNLRRTAGDAVRNIPCNVFTMTDLQYPFMLQSFGQIRSNTLNEFIYRRPSFYAVRNMFSFFDDEVKSVGLVDASFEIEKKGSPLDHAPRAVTVAKFSKKNTPVLLTWYSDSKPDDTLVWDRVRLTVPGTVFTDPVWVEMITGRVYEISPLDFTVKNGVSYFAGLPMWDAPGMIVERAHVPLAE